MGWKVAANAVAGQLAADVLLFNSDIERGIDDEVIDVVHRRRRRKGIILIPVTSGGDADAAYRIARCLQDNYERFTVIVSGYCKSAGTLCILGAQDIVMSECGELGPLDIQFYKKDELGELSSGLVLPAALKTLRDQAFTTFEQYMLQIKEHSLNLITFKTATEIATRMVVGLYGPIFSQIDPMQIGEVSRSMAIARSYGTRLMIKSENFDENTLDHLVSHYPSHGFVIDSREVNELFKHVRPPNIEEEKLLEELGNRAMTPGRDSDVEFLSDELVEVKNELIEVKDEKEARRKSEAGDQGKRNESPAETFGEGAQSAKLPSKRGDKGRFI